MNFNFQGFSPSKNLPLGYRDNQRKDYNRKSDIKIQNAQDNAVKNRSPEHLIFKTPFFLQSANLSIHQNI